MSSLFSDPEIPKYIYICGLAGLVLLSVSLICYSVVFGVYRDKQDLSLKPLKEANDIDNALSITSLVCFILGIILCLFIVYGHIIKSRKDPQIVYGPDSHVYMEFPETNEFVNLEDEKNQI